MFPIPQLTFNLIFFSLIGLLCVLGFFFGENRLKNISYGGFMGFFVLLVTSETLQSDIAAKTSLGVELAKLGFVALVCILMFLGALLHQKTAGNKIRSIFLGILTALFLVSFGLSILPAATREKLVTDFNLAALTYNSRFIVMAVLVVWLIVIQLLPKKKSLDERK